VLELKEDEHKSFGAIGKWHSLARDVIDSITMRTGITSHTASTIKQNMSYSNCGSITDQRYIQVGVNIFTREKPSTSTSVHFNCAVAIACKRLRPLLLGRNCLASGKLSQLALGTTTVGSGSKLAALAVALVNTLVLRADLLGRSA
jgi:hypothetical protein